MIPVDMKKNICEKSYIGSKGYTIPLSCLSKEEETFLKKDLMVKPELFSFNSSNEVSSFPLYRENAKKIYVPRFYGIERYGEPSNLQLSFGNKIDITFSKELRDYQEHIVNTYVQHVQSKKHGGGILEVKTGSGKTVMALKIISLMKLKTIILVHKEFLMNQWIERIQEFLPNAKIGKIQGKIFDIDDKDIVIGMIQSIYDKEFTSTAFQSFGLTVIDEVHRVGSQHFSKSLFKIVTPYMLGISATVERKDGLTKILYMFIGDKLYEDERKDYDPVVVHAIDYETRDVEFNETLYDWRGNPQYSKMIVKLCEFIPRCEFIIRVIHDLIKEHPANQIMILGHNKSILKYLHDEIERKQISTVGYYVGGMKENELKKTETKQIVIATYSMASEALDIKTLSTLVMVTPKTDIVQSVGRILRIKHTHPIIVDIIDPHELFKNQWKKRMTFYRKSKYVIQRITSSQYVKENWNENRKWNCVFVPKKDVEGDVDEEESTDEHSTQSEKKGFDKNEKSTKGKCFIQLDEL